MATLARTLNRKSLVSSEGLRQKCLLVLLLMLPSVCRAHGAEEAFGLIFLGGGIAGLVGGFFSCFFRVSATKSFFFTIAAAILAVVLVTQIAFDPIRRASDVLAAMAVGALGGLFPALAGFATGRWAGLQLGVKPEEGP